MRRLLQSILVGNRTEEDVDYLLTRLLNADAYYLDPPSEESLIDKIASDLLKLQKEQKNGTTK